jgi:tRNA threonylcarbamoyladenosine biosynthesis protein TsaE
MEEDERIQRTTRSPQETAALGRELAARAAAGDVWALVGELGAGKTHFVQGVAEGLGAASQVTSPTFTLLHEYTGGRLPLYHFDLYRLRSGEEALALGLEEYLDGDGLTVIEWADKFPPILPEYARWIAIELGEGDERTIRY